MYIFIGYGPPVMARSVPRLLALEGVEGQVLLQFEGVNTLLMLEG